MIRQVMRQLLESRGEEKGEIKEYERVCNFQRRALGNTAGASTLECISIRFTLLCTVWIL